MTEKYPLLGFVQKKGKQKTGNLNRILGKKVNLK